MIKLEYYRTAAGLSQFELAEKIGMTQQRISAYELGKRQPDLDTLKLFADFFGIEKNDSETEQAQAFADNIRERLAKENLPLRLKELSITIEQLASVAEDAASTDWINFMPCSMTSDTLFEILKSAY